MEDIIKILNEQEEKLRFESFSQNEAYKLGCFMVEYAKKHDITIAVSIRMSNGSIVFQHCPDGTNLLNQKWMTRKFNTVSLMERSSLLSALVWEKDGDSEEVHGLNKADYALCGGGFPIRLKGSDAVIGAVISSNLYHIADHEFIINCLKEYLNRPDVPMFEYNIPD